MSKYSFPHSWILSLFSYTVSGVVQTPCHTRRRHLHQSFPFILPSVWLVSETHFAFFTKASNASSLTMPSRNGSAKRESSWTVDSITWIVFWIYSPIDSLWFHRNNWNTMVNALFTPTIKRHIWGCQGSQFGFEIFSWSMEKVKYVLGSIKLFHFVCVSHTVCNLAKMDRKLQSHCFPYDRVQQ